MADTASTHTPHLHSSLNPPQLESSSPPPLASKNLSTSPPPLPHTCTTRHCLIYPPHPATPPHPHTSTPPHLPKRKPVFLPQSPAVRFFTKGHLHISDTPLTSTSSRRPVVRGTGPSRRVRIGVERRG